MLEFSKVKLNSFPNKDNKQVEEVNKQDIAIIGISLKLPQANSVNELWDILENGVDCVRRLPFMRREDTLQFLNFLNLPTDGLEEAEAAYLDEIDKFDAAYFRLSPKEASLMDPNQRIFLETAWSAIEDAGYGGNQLIGSKTGVYVGYGSDSDYKKVIAATDPDALSMCVPGNIRPIIASRLSYLMDFHGPNLILDTTCSSSLLAVHLACQGIRQGECDLAVAGGVQLHLLPVRQADIGIEASDGRAKSFDDRSDGTGTGEGAAAIILKPLQQALQDGDSIYAVIKGSAVNHDGASIGITAPNAVAQEDVIVSAWMNAGIRPETISYIEAHGTGTKLGDPIEIDGIERAFRRFTKKKSFCAVGSIKTNIGHLDNSAGIAGLLKAVLALDRKKLPASLHFQKPNRKIKFEDSPVYVNDRLRIWDSEGSVRRCGVSSFGLSGTNCHVVLEEAPEPRFGVIMKDVEANDRPSYIFVLSAKSKQSLNRLVTDYIETLNGQRGLLLRDICYTASVGRGHYSHRLAIIVENLDDLKSKLQGLQGDGIQNHVASGIYYDEHKSDNNEPHSKAQRDSLEVELSELCQLYVQGMNVNWKKIYHQAYLRRVHLPTYSFDRKRCWFEPRLTDKRFIPTVNETGFPLLDRHIVDSFEVDIYATDFHVSKHWVLNEHKILTDCVLVGTTYIEMVLEACEKYKTDDVLVELRDLLFLSPLVVKDDEIYEVHLTIHQGKSLYEFIISGRLIQDTGSQKKGPWVKLMEGKIGIVPNVGIHKGDAVQEIMKTYQDGYIQPDIDSYNRTSAFQFGPRWKNINGMYVGEKELLSCIEMPQAFAAEAGEYLFHPSLADNALATVPLLNQALAHISSEERIFLPFSYKRLRIYKSLPAKFYSLVRLNDEINENSQVISFDLTFTDESGLRIAEIEKYVLKKASKSQIKSAGSLDALQMFYEMKWVPQAIEDKRLASSSESVLILKGESQLSAQLIEQLTANGIPVIEATMALTSAKLNDRQFRFAGDQEGYLELINEVKAQKVTRIIHMLTLTNDRSIASLDELENSLQKGLYSLFYLTKSLLHHHLKNVEIIIVTQNVYKVTGFENKVVPENATLVGLGKVVDEEYKELHCRAIDIGQAAVQLQLQQIMNELDSDSRTSLAAYRGGERYVEEFGTIDNLSKKQEILIQDQAVYVITGGLGGIGLELAKYLTEKNQIKLAFINRQSFPERSHWETLLSNAQDEKLCHKIRSIRAMEQTGSEVRLFQTDVSSWQAMSAVLNDIRSRYGEIRGIIHSAGNAGDGFIIRKSMEQFREVILPKVHGTWLLDRLTAIDPLDFFINCSSNTTLMGVSGQGDYSAANAYLDAFSEYRSILGRRTLTINWPAWKETGMAFDYGLNVDTIFKALPTAKAIYAFSEILQFNSERVIVGELNAGGTFQGKTILDTNIRLASDIKLQVEQTRIKPSAPVQKSNKPAVTDAVKLSGKQVYSEIEEQISLVWREVLGYEELDVNDNFFEIGGDSILVTRVHNLIESYYPDQVSLADLFSYTSISAIAGYIEASNQKVNTISNMPSETEEKLEDRIQVLLEQLERGHVNVEDAIQRYIRL